MDFLELFAPCEDIAGINCLAQVLLKAGLAKDIFSLADRYHISAAQAEEYIRGKRAFLTDSYIRNEKYESARSKMMAEALELDDDGFADPLVRNFLSVVDQALAKHILMPNKSLKKCISFLMKKAQVLSQFHKDAGAREGIAVRDEIVFAWVAEYYLQDDYAEELEREKILFQNLMKSPLPQTSKTKKTVNKKKEKTTGTVGKGSHRANNLDKKITEDEQQEQLSLFNLEI